MPLENVMRIKNFAISLLAVLALCGSAVAQANPTSFAGEFRAWSFAYGIAPNVPALTVDLGSNTSGTYSVTVARGQVALADGTKIAPLSTNAKVTIGLGANQETVIPSSVSCSTPTIVDSCTFTATFSFAHNTGDRVSSGTVGLQEAVNYASTFGNPAGGVVITDGEWYRNSGTKAIMVATVSTTPNVWIFDTSGVGPVWYGKSNATSGAYSALNNDQSFQVTLVAGAATKTLSQTYAVAPSCVATYVSGTHTGVLSATPTTTTVVVGDSVSETPVVQVFCSLQK